MVLAWCTRSPRCGLPLCLRLSRQEVPDVGRRPARPRARWLALSEAARCLAALRAARVRGRATQGGAGRGRGRGQGGPRGARRGWGARGGRGLALGTCTRHKGGRHRRGSGCMRGRAPAARKGRSVATTLPPCALCQQPRSAPRAPAAPAAVSLGAVRSQSTSPGSSVASARLNQPPPGLACWPWGLVGGAAGGAGEAGPGLPGTQGWGVARAVRAAAGALRRARAALRGQCGTAVRKREGG